MTLDASVLVESSGACWTRNDVVCIANVCATTIIRAKACAISICIAHAQSAIINTNVIYSWTGLYILIGSGIRFSWLVLPQQDSIALVWIHTLIISGYNSCCIVSVYLWDDRSSAWVLSHASSWSIVEASGCISIWVAEETVHTLVVVCKSTINQGTDAGWLLADHVVVRSTYWTSCEITTAVSCSIKRSAVWVKLAGHWYLRRTQPPEAQWVIEDRDVSRIDVVHAQLLWHIALHPVSDSVYISTALSPSVVGVDAVQVVCAGDSGDVIGRETLAHSVETAVVRDSLSFLCEVNAGLYSSWGCVTTCELRKRSTASIGVGWREALGVDSAGGGGRGGGINAGSGIVEVGVEGTNHRREAWLNVGDAPFWWHILACLVGEYCRNVGAALRRVSEGITVGVGGTGGCWQIVTLGVLDVWRVEENTSCTSGIADAKLWARSCVPSILGNCHWCATLISNSLWIAV